MLPDGKRLHLQHGPIDLIVEAWGAGRADAYARAARRFETILEELVSELPLMRSPVDTIEATDKPLRSGLDTRFRNRVEGASKRLAQRRFETPLPPPSGPVATRMLNATIPFRETFITPMAAVAGAVADEIRSEIATVSQVTKAYVNNGGDVALYLSEGESFSAAVAAGIPAHLTITHDLPVRGIATSGWRGRSHSLGIADSVTVLARTAAAADAAATLIANAVDLPGHPGIRRQPASELSPDSDLGDRLVTVDVPPLAEDEKDSALQNGLALADDYLDRKLIRAAYLVLQSEVRDRTAPCLPGLEKLTT